jgi:uncharacterized membrane protein YeaQ/YmgE (transglycosylase-associated protein family)
VRFDPTTTFLIVLVIGVVLGLVFDRFLGRGWLARQVTGGRHSLVTSALVGVAGSFVGYHIALLMRVGAGWPTLIGAAIGALVVLWVWRMIRYGVDFLHKIAGGSPWPPSATVSRS